MITLRRLAIFFCLLLIPLSIGASSPCLTRGYACFLNDPLPRAIEQGNCEEIRKYCSHLPVALEAQYKLLNLTQLPHVRECVLSIIKEEWARLMYASPITTTGLLLFEFARLLLPWSTCSGKVEHGFMVMLDDLKKDMQRCYAKNGQVLEAIGNLPCIYQPPALRSLIAMQIAKELLNRESANQENCANFDREAWLATLPEDLRELITKYLPQLRLQ
jgi:hypothetical protein